MKNVFLAMALGLAAAVVPVACTHSDSDSTYKSTIIPKPAQIKTAGSGSMALGSETTIYISAPDSVKAQLSGYISQALPDVKVSDKEESGNQIRLLLEPDKVVNGSSEGYTLSVDSKKGCDIVAGAAPGLFYGLQTAMQLMEENGMKCIPEVEITDSPRFSYRGMMIDVSRNFRDKEWIKKQIDAIARLKLNTLHFHLTDGAGWRLQIDKYPRLTEFAAWRKGKTWKDWNQQGNQYVDRSDPEAQGGFYTKDDIREILAYAAERNITVIPEIEMPSHSEEVTAAYPELSCTHNPKGVSDFCPGNEKTFEFLQNVLDEVMELFPSHYINIGGDEAPKTTWRTCRLCAARMKAEGLENVDQLQSYLVHRIEKYLNSKGRDLIGWDEIMEGGLAPNATVVSWRGIDGGINAAKNGNKAVMAPGRYLYFDGYQDAPATQPEAIGGYLPLETVYSFNPAPDSLGKAVTDLITGLEATLFTEYIPTDEHAEYMLYPRMYALAEVGWTPQDQRNDYAEFRNRALSLNEKMKQRGYNVFDLANEIGNRPEAKDTIAHLAVGKTPKYIVDWWRNYPANGDNTLTDGLRGGWNYNDGRWQGYAGGEKKMDVVIDLEKVEDVSFIGADFMQLIGPGVWMPAKVVISVSDDGENFRELKTIDHEQKETTSVSFKNYGWEGSVKARYVRYQAYSAKGCLFTDEIVIR